MTVEGDQPAKPVDPQASLRAELLSEIAGAQAVLEVAIAELSRAGGSSGQLAESRSQLALLTNLGLQLGMASGATLASLRGEVTAAASAASSAAQQARIAADDMATNSPAAAARQTITDLSHDYYDRKVLDPYLKFQSDEDEKAYRKREQENQEAIRRELAKGTPEGNHNAALIFNRQLNDARTHGADASPDFADMAHRNHEAIRDSEANRQQSPATAVQPNITPPPVPDSELADVRAILKSAGVTTPADNNASPNTTGTPRINREPATPARS